MVEKQREIRNEDPNSSEVNEVLQEFMDKCIPKVKKVFAEILEEDRKIYQQKLDEYQQQIYQLQKKLVETQAELARRSQPATVL